MADLLFRTACHESLCGQQIIQVGGGPARGVYQMEGATHDDVWDTYINVFPALKKRIEAAGFRWMSGDSSKRITPPLSGLVTPEVQNKKRPLLSGFPGASRALEKVLNTNLGKGTVENLLTM